MATFSGVAPVRDDFRCSLCRQKNAFHCEHDTPYRDQLLGSYYQEKPYMGSKNSRRDPHRKRASDNYYNDSTSNDNVRHANTDRNVNPNTGRNLNSNTGRNVNSNTDRNVNPNTDPRYQQSRKIENTSPTNQYSYDHARTNEKKTKNKSCVIL